MTSGNIDYNVTAKKEGTKTRARERSKRDFMYSSIVFLTQCSVSISNMKQPLLQL